MNRKAFLYRTSKNGKKAFYIDEDNAEQIIEWIEKDPGHAKKFDLILEQLLEHPHISRDLYDKEDIEKGCEHVTAMKPFKGTRNPRIYCQQYTHKDLEVFVIVASELLEKKKSDGLSNKERTIIRRVASYQYTLES